MNQSTHEYWCGDICKELAPDYVCRKPSISFNKFIYSGRINGKVCNSQRLLSQLRQQILTNIYKYEGYI